MHLPPSIRYSNLDKSNTRVLQDNLNLGTIGTANSLFEIMIITNKTVIRMVLPSKFNHLGTIGKECYYNRLLGVVKVSDKYIQYEVVQYNTVYNTVR
jgi:hypothetical protein